MIGGIFTGIGLGASGEEMGLELCNQTTVAEQYACSLRNIKRQAEYYCARGSVGDCQSLGVNVPEVPTPLYGTGANLIYMNNVAEPYVVNVTPTNTTNQTSVPPVTTTPASNTPIVYRNGVMTFKASRSTGTLYPGDSWSIEIKGATPNQDVMVKGGKGVDGSASIPTNATPVKVGVTNSSGDFKYTAVVTAADVGTWAQEWNVAYYVPVNGKIAFVVAAGTGTVPSNTTNNQTQTQTAVMKLYNKSTGMEIGAGGQLKVGEVFRIQISGLAAYAPIAISATKNGVSLGTTGYTANTDGTFSLEGQVGATEVGSWVELVQSGASQTTWNFSVVQPATTQTPVNTTNGTQTTQTTNTAATGANNTAQNQGSSEPSDFSIGFNALFDPNQWGDVFQNGSTGQKLGLLILPLGVFGLFAMSGRR